MDDLRKKALKIISSENSEIGNLSDLEIKKIFEELRVHQIELEMQNRELQESRLELEKSKQKYLELFELSPIGFVILDEKGIIQEANKNFCTIFGRYKKHLHLHPFVSLINHDSMSIFYDHIESVINTSVVKTTELSFSKNNSIHYISVQSGKVDKGKILSSIQDITERKKTEEILSEKNDHLRAIFEQAAVGICRVTLDNKFVQFNQRFCEIMGYSQEELNQLSFSEITYPEDWEEECSYLNHLYSQEIKSYCIDNRYIRKDSSIVWVRITVSPLYNSSKQIKYLIKIVEDITEQKMLESQLLKAKDIADTANRAKSDFIANMSHEIRTPLNAVIGFSELLLSDNLQEQHKNYVKSIISGGYTLLSIINDILDISKIEAGKIELRNTPNDIANILNNLSQMFSHKIKEKELNYIQEIADTFPNVLIDGVRLNQILLNLIGNAIKFTETGYVKIVLRILKETETLLDFAIDIIDTGIGIPSSEFEEIFTPFVQRSRQDSRKYGGTGLGLSICKRLVSLMGGDILLESVEEQGSKFTVCFYNIAIIDNWDTKEESSNVDKIALSHANVLVVDDVELNIDLIQFFLNKKGITVHSAHSGKEALNILEFFRPDLILMDIKMPEMDGTEVTKIIKSNEKLKSIPVIAFTASVMELKNSNKYKLFDGYIKKPLLQKDLIAELIKFLPHHPIHLKESETKKEPYIEKNYLLNQESKIQAIATIESIVEDIKLLLAIKNINSMEAFLKKLSSFIYEYHFLHLEPTLNLLKDYINNIEIILIDKSLNKLQFQLLQLKERLI